MIHLRKLYVTIFMLLLSTYVHAQAYIPKDGEKFFFYPVSNNIANTVNGYDCFYSTDLAYKNDKFKIKPKFRFKVNDNELTPFSEIEGHQFTMISSVIENKNEKKLEKKVCILFLTRDDGEKLFLRVPYIRKEEDNTLTRAMSLLFKTTTGKSNYKINIPCCPVSKYNEAADYISGQNIISYHRGRTSLEKAKDLLVKQSDFLGGFIPEGLFTKSGYELSCDSVGFRNIESYFFKQPVAYCKYDNRNVILPLFDFRGAGNSTYGEGFTLADFFARKGSVRDGLINSKDYPAKLLAMPGKRLRYDGTGVSTMDSYKLKQIRYWDNNKQYYIKNQTAYNCEAIDLSNEHADHFGLCAVMTDSLGKKFQIPLDLIDLSDNKFTNHPFELEEDFLARQRDWQASQKAFDERCEKENAEKEQRLRKKYGAKKAAKMMKGAYEIGWTVEEVREAVGPYYFECIHTYKDKYAYYEQFQHGKYDPSLLLFKNGKLVSITN